MPVHSISSRIFICTLKRTNLCIYNHLLARFSSMLHFDLQIPIARKQITRVSSRPTETRLRDRLTHRKYKFHGTPGFANGT